MAALPETLTLSHADVMCGLTLRVQIAPVTKWRTAVAVWLIGIAGRVLGCNVDVGLHADKRTEVLPEDRRLIDRRAGCVYVCTHESISSSGREPVWLRINLPD